MYIHSLLVLLGTSIIQTTYSSNHPNEPREKEGLLVGSYGANHLDEPKDFRLSKSFFYHIPKNESGHLYTVSARHEGVVAGSAGTAKLQPSMPIKLHRMRISRPSPDSLRDGFVARLRTNDAPIEAWYTADVYGPDTGDKATVVNLAKMCSDAYVETPAQPDWLNTSLGFNHSDTFGWKSDGLRGHVFTDKLNETVIVAFKGTSIDPRDGWSSNDKLNDNQLFSCCCASQRPPPFWYPAVCGCRTATFQCNATCITNEILQENRYYIAALQVLQNVTSSFPNANFWVVGHSLGGAMASLMGLTFNIPSVSYEAVPEKLAAQRLGLDIPPYTGGVHIGNNADPVYMGACNGYFSTCSIAGFAFESQCHTGKRCVYDTVTDRGWRSNINNHRLNVVIPEVLEYYNVTPSCEADHECVDCYNWEFHD